MAELVAPGPACRTRGTAQWLLSLKASSPASSTQEMCVSRSSTLAGRCAEAAGSSSPASAGDSAEALTARSGAGRGRPEPPGDHGAAADIATRPSRISRRADPTPRPHHDHRGTALCRQRRQRLGDGSGVIHHTPRLEPDHLGGAALVVASVRTGRRHDQFTAREQRRGRRQRAMRAARASRSTTTALAAALRSAASNGCGTTRTGTAWSPKASRARVRGRIRCARAPRSGGAADELALHSSLSVDVRPAPVLGMAAFVSALQEAISVTAHR
jgi:hypothetical protein